jgi:Spy/CpxP family protein refolding chaperone
MKNVKWIFVTLLFLTIGNTRAQKMDSTKSSRHGHRMTSMYGISNLTDDQKKKIKELRTPLNKEILPLRNQLAEKRAHLKTLQIAEKVDMKSINNTIDEMSQLQSQIIKKEAAHTQAIRAILTDDQRIAFDMRTNSGRKFHQHRRMTGDRSRRG